MFTHVTAPMPTPQTAPAAAADGVIAGLSSYIAIHAPFWLWDMIMRRLRPPDEDAGGSSRM